MKSTSRPRPCRPRLRLEALEGRTLLTGAGTLDPSFGAGYGFSKVPLGIASFPQVQNAVYGANSVIAETAAQGGKIVVSGAVLNNFSNQFAIARFNADGSVDGSFGLGGEVKIPIDAGSGPVSTIVQQDGKILEATSTKDGGGNPTYVVVRLNLDGSLDPTYGTNGVAEYPASTTTPVASRLGTVVSALAQSDGKIVLAGSATDNTANITSFAAVRLDGDGSLDTGYGQGGTSDVPVTVAGFTSNLAVAATIQADNKLILAGTVQVGTFGSGRESGPAQDVGVIRLDTNGLLDTSYGGPTVPGAALISPDLADPMDLGQSSPTAVTLQPADGKVLISGFSNFLSNQAYNGSFLDRLNTDGSLDTGFGTTSRVAGSHGPDGNLSQGILAVQPDGKILEAAYTGNYVPQVSRFNPDGTLDPTFVDASTPRLARGNQNVAGNVALTIRPGGQILVAQYGSVPSLVGRVQGFTLEQLLSSSSTGPAPYPIPITPFDVYGQGYTDSTIYDPTSSSFFVKAFTTFNAVQTTPFGSPGYGKTLPALADYEGIGQADYAAYLPDLGVYAIRPQSGPDAYFAIGTTGTGQTIPVPADYEGIGRADVAVYLTASGTFADASTGREVQFGTPGVGQSIPAPADYYGTHQADIAVYLTGPGAFAIQDPTGQTPGGVVPFGMPGLGNSIPVPGDYDGSGHIELAVFVPSTATFYYRPFKADSPDVAVPFGTPGVGELPVVGDYDGSGRTEVAVYDPSRGFIAYRPANGGPDVITYVGSPNSGAIPVATPSGALLVFSSSGSGGGNAHALSFGSTGTSTSSVSMTPSRSASVPVGPVLASFRVARTLVNQASLNPGNISS